MSWDKSEQFLKAVLAPSPKGGYANMHYSFSPKDDPSKKVVSGRAFTAIGDLIGYAKWSIVHATAKDIWYCTSLQSQCRTTSNGKKGAVRLAANSLALRAVWMDVDVDPNDTTGKHYTSIGEAWDALVAFRTAHQLPMFSAAVRSGGGLQVYFISDKNLDPHEWRPYAEGLRALATAHGLKFDAGLTTDNCRLLRVPQTFNYKYDPARLVELMPIPLVVYDFATTFAAFVTAAPAVTAGSNVTELPFDPTLFPMGGGATHALLKGVTTGSLGAGIEQREMPPLDPEPIVRRCGFFKEALLNGGATYDNPLWNLTLLGAAFMTNGEVVAHALSKGHPKYVHKDTQAQFERKLRDRAERDIGWPSCAAIAGNGCTSCATCPLKGTIKSPMELGVTATVTDNAAAVAMNAVPTGATIAPKDWMPENYCFNSRGIICKIDDGVDKEGNSRPTILHPIFQCQFTNPWASSGNSASLNFTVNTDLGNLREVAIPQAILGNQNKLYESLGRQEVRYNPEKKALLETFLMSLITKLHSMQAASNTSKYGWDRTNGQVSGFAYGGTLYLPNGSTLPTGIGDARAREYYRPIGELQPWFDAARITMDEKRPELDVIIAASFAAPLAGLTGKDLMSISVFGESGAHKSAAIAVGNAVWGHPKLTKLTADSTANMVFKYMGEVSVLPLYWDEISEEKPMKQVASAILHGTQGIEKGRLEQDASLKARGVWATVLVSCANRSMVDYMATLSQEHHGYINRVFEYRLDKRPVGTEVGFISDADASKATLELSHNYGVLGRQYAKLLAANIKQAEALVNAIQKQIERDLNVQTEERFWKTTVAVLLASAHFANKLGVNFDIPAMKSFLYDAFLYNRKVRSEVALPTSTVLGAEDVLDTYLKHRMMQQTIWCDRSPPRGAGRKGTSMVNMLHVPDNHNTALPVVVRFDRMDRMLRISQKDFRKFLDDQKVAGYRSTMVGLTKALGARLSTGRYVLGAGTRYGTLPETLIEIPIPAASVLDDMMTNFGGRMDGQEVDSLATGISLTAPPDTVTVTTGGPVPGMPITAAIMETINADRARTGG